MKRMKPRPVLPQQAANLVKRVRVRVVLKKPVFSGGIIFPVFSGGIIFPVVDGVVFRPVTGGLLTPAEAMEEREAARGKKRQRQKPEWRTLKPRRRS